MLTKAVERDSILKYLEKWEPRQYHSPAAGVGRAVFRYSSSETDISCSCIKNAQYEVGQINAPG